MSYVIINKKPVFLSLDKYTQLKEEVLKGKESVYKVSSTISGSKASIETDKSMFKILNQKHIENSNNFYNEWLKFDLVDMKASQNVWDLLYDYCHYHRNGYLSDLRDVKDKIIEDYQGDSYHNPMGNIFMLNLFTKPLKWWDNNIFNKTGYKNTNILIISQHIYRLVGDLTKFIIFSEDFKLVCGDYVTVLPSSLKISNIEVFLNTY